MSRYELARTGLKPKDVARLLDLYGVSAADKDELLTLADEATKRGWWDTYTDVLPEELVELIGLEDDATLALTWQVECIPGLLQTESYALQVIRGVQDAALIPPRTMARRVKARVLRQQVLTRDSPVELWAIIDESALSRGAEDPEILREQLTHLVEVSARPNVTIQVLELATSLPSIVPSFVYMEFDGSESLPNVAYTEQLLGSIYFDADEETLRYKQAHEQLADVALTPSESRELITARASHM